MDPITASPSSAQKSGTPRLLPPALVIFGVLALSALPATSSPTPRTSASAKPVVLKRLPAPGRQVKPERKTMGAETEPESTAKPQRPEPGRPVELKMQRAASRRLDVRALPPSPPRRRGRPEREPPEPLRGPIPSPGVTAAASSLSAPPLLTAAAPSPLITFEGLDYANWGAGHPPDTNGDVGPEYYIQSINTSIGIYRKSDGVRVAAFSFDSFMSQGDFGNLCDTDNYGDPVVLYDTFEDRWIVSDFAFKVDSGGNVVNPPGAFQCFAVSMSGDPVTGGWNYYSINTAGGLGDYPKLGIWPDGLYLSVNMFDYSAAGSFQTARVYALNKAQMYAGSPTIQVVSFDAPSGEFTILPANARLQAGTPPAGSPNHAAAVWQYTNAVSVYDIEVHWDAISTSKLSAPMLSIAPSTWADAPETVPSLGGNAIETLADRLMMQNQYTNDGGSESLWLTHTVAGSTASQAAVRWYQVDVSGGAVAPSTSQAATHNPDALNRFMPSLAVDRAGNLAVGYSTSSSSGRPAIRYAGRLAGDPANVITQTEVTLIAGTGSQSGSCGGTCTRWGDYSAMSLDPDGCTFWYTNQYYATTGLNHQTRIGSFRFPSCTNVQSGTLTGTITELAGGTPIAGATVSLGTRTATTLPSGGYSFADLPPGTYPAISVAYPGYVTATDTGIEVPSGGTAVHSFALETAPVRACRTDTSQSDFERGIPAGVELTTTPGSVELTNLPVTDQQNLSVTSNGFGFTTTSWFGQTFTAAKSGPLTAVEVDLFCSGCSGTSPDIVVALRATSNNLPTGADLATATIPGFTSASGGLFKATFASPITVASGTRYAIVLRPLSNPSAGTYAYVVSSGSPYSGGRSVTSSNSGSSWTGGNTDVGFRTWVRPGYSASGTFVSGPIDANPAAGATPRWVSLAWNGTVPANTSLSLQVAGSASPDGPFDFTGPDGTASTYFTSGSAPLLQYDGSRYLKYKALLASTLSSATPLLHDVTICEDSGACGSAATITPTASQLCSGSSGNSASGPAGAGSYQWWITNGSITAGSTSRTVTYTAGSTGLVTLTLAASDGGGCTTSDSVSLPIVAIQKPAISGALSFCAGGQTTLTSSSASGNQWFRGGVLLDGATGQTYSASVAGTYTVQVSAPGCVSPLSDPATVSVTPLPATPSITPNGPTTFCNGSSVTLTSSSASGNQWYRDGSPISGSTGQQLSATAAGSYTVVVTTAGCSSVASAPVAVTVVSVPAAPSAVAGGPTTFCAGGSVTLTSSAGSGNQWYRNGTQLAGENGQQYVATLSGSYTVTLTNGGCTSTPSNAITVTVNALPATPTITASGATTFCAGGSVTLTSSASSGNQWYRDGVPVGGATAKQYAATGAGDYTVMVTASGCSSTSSPTHVTVTPLPETPAVSVSGPTSFCAGGSVTLTSTSATGNQWYRNGAPVGGATAQQLLAATAGDYSVVVTSAGCASSPSAATTVTVNAFPDASVTAPASLTTGAGSNAAVATAGAGATYAWSISNGTIDSGQGTRAITFTAGAAGTLQLEVSVSTAAGCTRTGSASIAIEPAAVPVDVTSVTPAAGRSAGGSAVTLAGSGFQPGAAVTFGGSAATEVAVVNQGTITAKSGAHAAGVVDVKVTNLDASSGTLLGGFTYVENQFDPNGDGEIDPADIFYLVNFLFLGGPAPAGVTGPPSGDANGDDTTDPADIFYLVNHLFTGGPAPLTRTAVTAQTLPGREAIAGALTLGPAVRRDGHLLVPLILMLDPGSATPSALSLQLHVPHASSATISRADGLVSGNPLFEISRTTEATLTYLLVIDPAAGMQFGSPDGTPAVVAQLSLPGAAGGLAGVRIEPGLTMLTAAGGNDAATAANGRLRILRFDESTDRNRGPERPQ